MSKKTYKQRVLDLENLCDIQGTKGTYDFDEYMRGLANGLKLAVSCFDDKSPDYFPAPKRKMDIIKRFLCKYLDWGFPTGKMKSYDAFQSTYECRFCDRPITQDSTGAWFHLTK